MLAVVAEPVGRSLSYTLNPHGSFVARSKMLGVMNAIHSKRFEPPDVSTIPDILLDPEKTCRYLQWKELPRGGSNGNEDQVLENTSAPLKSSILRIRQPDGTIRKVIVPPDQWGTTSLVDVVKVSVEGASSYTINMPDGSTIRCNTQKDPDQRLYQALSESGLSHGSLITIIASSTNKPKVNSVKTKHAKQDRFDPFPELAKDYDAAMLKAKIRRNSGSSGGMSYAALAALQSALHNVEPQPTGPIHRIYMCERAASRFHGSGIQTDKHENRVGLLFGVVSSERKDIHRPRKARTSLSSTVESEQYCSAVRVHALWEPPTVSSSSSLDYRTTLLQQIHADAKVLRLAKNLGLQPIGWIFSYTNERSSNDGLPVWDDDIETGARLQIELMKQGAATFHESAVTSDDGATRFGTLAMDARTGSTEAFQLSNVAIQMVAENMFALGSQLSSNESSRMSGDMEVGSRYIKTRHPVIVDGKETKEIDSVLCLVNTALLSHSGWYTGRSIATSSTKKRDGTITSKVRKAILKEIDSTESDSKLLETLCDFSILLALDDLLSPLESENLCATISKWARGQKKSVSVDELLKQKLKRALDRSI